MTMNDAVLLSPAQMYEADRLTIEGGISGPELMESAGSAVTEQILLRWPEARHAAILCGPGNNAGDGFVVARQLTNKGWRCDLYLLVDREQLKGDAAWAADLCTGPVRSLGELNLEGVEIVVDALFGTGLNRGLDGPAAQAVETVLASNVPVVAIDIASGVDGASGRVATTSIQAELTVTFFRKKPGHLLFPGRQCCGEVSVAQIGISPSVLDSIHPEGFENGPEVWRASWPTLHNEGHKYHRGHTISVSGPAERTGAARLAALGALRVGSGLVTVASPADALAANAAHLTAIMLTPVNSPGDLDDLLQDKRFTGIVIGPALGVDAYARGMVLSALQGGLSCVLDADALTCFTDDPDELFRAIAALPERSVVLTPHGGEFARLFSPEKTGPFGKVSCAQAAAHRSKATVIFKGPDTVIACPDGRYAINANAPPSLATAGAGDVLAGMTAGLLAQSMPAFEAACAAAWLHGEAAAKFGPGLIAEDLPNMLPAVLTDLLRYQ